MTTGSPWFRAANTPEPESIPADPYGYGQSTPYEPEPAPYAPEQGPYAPEPSSYTPEPAPYEPAPEPSPYQPEQAPYAPASYAPEPAPVYEPAYEAPAGSEAGHDAPREAVGEPYAAEEPAEPPRARHDETMPLRAVEPLPGPGRAERRRAAKGGRGRTRGAAAPAARTEASGEARPLSRVEARRAAKAAKESVGVVASRAVGELFITFGVVMLLFVTYQLWWTNVLAGQETDRAKERIEDTWAKGDDPEKGDDGKPGAFEPGEGFAIMYIPKLDVVVPIAEGISKAKVLDKGMVGHYGEGKLKTAMPADKQGNFAVAGHRNTHGEPFRYINQLKPGDPIVVETRNAYYTYEMASILPQTSPSNVSVIEPVPKGSGFTKPGRFITLTTCTPEFTSTYRMIVWGKLVEERPRSEGKPQALVG
ncbi:MULTISPECIES: class E sortase [Streptomyces]|uniref:Peptidase C60 family protein n=1 Tax=Streptomyces viridochromogenes TaxID=1938 RepID=A0A0L8KQ74_STRVR|nr:MULTISPECIES: class E sortase [Streptomyces]KOG28072.1 peptidase C60 family protein [Streptomyces viridochromogenes]